MNRRTIQRAVLLAACLATWTVACIAESIEEAGRRGPGTKGPATDLKLQVPQTFDLTHVEAIYFAEALEKNPQQIFEFVRNHIAYEVYTGCLRGPRGTLLAMAGNSVDRAALLANMLEASGQKVRFARGTLDASSAKTLVLSMWADRPRARPSSDKSDDDAKSFENNFLTNVKRDYHLLREHLLKLDSLPPIQPPHSTESLVKEAQSHYWVQWLKDDEWIDLDPSFVDSAPGQSFATKDATFDVLPDNLYHKMEIRVRIEEYGVMQGDAAVTPSNTVLLTHKARAADLSGRSLDLLFQPENWTGPAANFENAFTTALKSTGKIKPVLVIGQGKWEAGKLFRQRLPTGTGIGGIGGLLGGDGTRKPVQIATAVFLEFDLVNSDGKKETVTRDLLDLAGPARRDKKLVLSAAVVRELSAKGHDLTNAFYSVFVTTGRIDFAHRIIPPVKRGEKEMFLDDVLQGMNLTLAVASDALLQQVGQLERAKVCFYPDSPRLYVAEYSVHDRQMRFALDLRRDRARAVASGDKPEELRWIQVLRGVTSATLERLVLEHMTRGDVEKKRLLDTVSTSSLMDQAAKENLPCVVLKDLTTFNTKVSEDTVARLRQELDRGCVVVAPRAPLSIGGRERLAWWRVQPATGETVAVTDDGLHGAVFVMLLQTGTEYPEVTVVKRAETELGTAYAVAVAEVIEGRLWVSMLGYYWNLGQAEIAAASIGTVVSNPWWLTLLLD